MTGTQLLEELVQAVQSLVQLYQLNYVRLDPRKGTHRTSVAVRVCPCVSVSTHRTSVAVHQYTYQHVGPWTQHADPSRGLFGTFVAVLCVRVCPSVSASTHRTSVAVHQYTYQHVGPWTQHADPSYGLFGTLVLGLSTLALPKDFLGDFWPTWTVCSVHRARLWVSISTHRTSVGVRQYTQDVRGCLCVSVSTHMMSVAVHEYTYQHGGLSTHKTSVGVCQHTQDVRGCPSAHTGRPWVSVSTHLMSVAVRVCPCVSVSTHRTSVAVHQYTYQHVGSWTQHADPSRAHTGRPWLSVCVCVCPSAHTGRLWLSISTHISMVVLGLSTLTFPVDCSGDFGPRGLSVKYTQDVCGYPSAHTGRPCVSVSTHMTSVAVLVCLCVSVNTHRTSVAVHQYTYQHVGPLTQHADPSRGLFGTHRTSVAVHQYTYQHVGPWSQHADPSRGLFGTSVAVCGCPSAHTGRLWLSMCVRQHTQDVRGCPTSVAVRVCPCVSVSTHRTSVAVHQYTYQHVGPWTQHADPSRGLFGTSVAVLCVRVCPSVSVSTHRTSVAIHQYTYQHVGPWTQHADPSHGLFGTSVVVRVCPCVSVCVRQHTQDVCGCPSYTQHVRGCPPAHTGLPWLSVCVRVCLSVSVSTHMTSVAVHQYTYQHYTQDVHGCPPAYTGCPWLSVAVRQHTHDVRGCPCVSVSTHRTSVGVRQHTQDVYVCPTSVAVHQYTYQHVGPWTQHADPSRGLFGTSVAVLCVRVCPSVSVSKHRTSVAVHHTHRTSVGVRQHTHDIRGCSCVSVCVRLCPSAHTGHLWLSISTHISMLVLGLSTLALPMDCSGDFGPRGLSVLYTQDVRGCRPAHTGRLWLSVCVRECLCVSVSTHRTSVAVHQYTYQHVGPWSQHADPSRGLFGTSVAVCGCPSAHTGRLWLSMCVRQHTQDVRGCPTSVAVRVCPCVSVSTHRTSVAVHQYTYQHVGPWTQHADPSRGLFGTHISTLVLGLSTLTLPMDCSGDFSPRGLSTQYTQDVRWCPPAHTGRPWLFVCVRVCPFVSVSTHRTSVAVHQYTYQHVVHTARPWVFVSSHRTSVGVRQHTQDVCGCLSVCPSAHTGRLWLSMSTHISTLVLGLSTLALPMDCSSDFGPRGLSVQYTQDVCGCPSAHRTSMGVRQHTLDVRGCPTLTLPVDCLGDFGPRGLSVQYTQDVRGYPSAHTGHPSVSVSTHRTSVAVRVCLCVSVSTHRTSVAVHHTQDVCGYPSADKGLPCVSVSTHMTSVAVPVCPCVSVNKHRTSVAVHQYTYQHVGPLTQHADPSRGLFGTSVAVRVCSCVTVCVRQHTQDVRACPSVHISARWLSVQYTQDVRGCPPAHTGLPWLSVCVRVCLSVSVSTHRTSVAVHQYTYQHYTQDVHGCPPAYTGCPWLSVAVRQHTHDVRGCPCVSVSTHRTSVGVRQHTQDVYVCPTSVAVHQYTYQHVGPWTQHADPSRGLFGTSVAVLCVRVCPSVSVSKHRTSVAVHHTHRTSVGVRQHTHDIRGCSCVSVCVRLCPSAHTGHLWLSISTHISMLVLGLSTLALPMDCSGDFGPRGLSVLYTQDVRGCRPAHTGRLWLSVCVRECLCVSVSTHRTSVAVHQYTYQHVGPWSQHADPSRGLFGTSVAVCGCPSAHTGRLWLSMCVRQHTQDVRGCPTSVAVRVCPCVSVSTHRTSVAVHQYTYQHVGPWTQHADPSRGLFGTFVAVLCVRVCPSVSVSTHRTSVAIHQYTYQHVGPWTQHADPSHGLFGTSVVVRVCPCVSVCVRQHTQDVCGCPSVHISARCTHSTSVGVCQLTQDVCGCPSAHTGRLWLSVCVSVSTHRTSVAVHDTHKTSVGVRQHTGRPWVSVSTHWMSVAVRVCPCVSVSTHMTSLAVHQYTYQHVGPWTQHADPSRGLFGTSVCVRQHTQDVCGCPCVSVCVRQHTQDVRGCPSVHISARCTQDVCGYPSADKGLPCVSVSTHMTSVAVPVCPCVSVNKHRTSVAVHQYTYQHVGPLTQHADPSRGLFGTSVAVRVCSCVTVCVRQHTQDVRACPSVHISARWLSVQYTQDVRGCPPAHTGLPWLSVCVRVCLSVSVSTHRTSVAVHQYTYQHYTQDVHGCPPAYTGCPWLSVAVRQHTHDVRGCPCVSVSTHRTSVGVRQHTQDVYVCPTSVAVHQYTYQHVGPWTQHADPSRGLFGTSVAVLCVRVCPSVSVRKHRTSVAVHQYTYQHVGPWTQHADPSHGLFGTHRTSVAVHQYTYQHVGPWTQHAGPSHGLFGTSVGVRQHTQDVCGSLCVSVSTHRTSVAVHEYTYQHVGPWTQHAGPSRGLFGTSVGVRQHTLDVCGCPCVTLTLPVDCLGDFGPRGLSVQYTQDVRGYPSAHTGHPSVSVSTHRTSVAVRVCLCVSVSTHRTSLAVHQDTYQHGGPCTQHADPSRGLFGTHMTSVAVPVCPCVSVNTHKTSVAVHQYTYQHVGPLTQHADPSRGLFGTHISTLVLGLSTLALPVDWSGDFGPRGLSVQYTHDVSGCPPAHTGRLWLSVCVRVCPSVFRQHTQDVCGCLWLSVSTHRTFVAVHVCPLAHKGRPWVSVSTHRTSVCVRQHIQDVCGCLWLSVSTQRTFVAVHVSPSAHKGRLWVSVSTHRTSVCVRQHTQDVRGCPCVSVCVRQHTQDVRGCPSVHISARWSLASAC
ncbi:hypothetical protein YC2023_066105 [Brassica napus]